MATTQQPLKYLWRAYFADRTIKQPADDRYSKHDDKAEHNPSAFRDVVEHQEKFEMSHFSLYSSEGEFRIGIELRSGIFYTGNGNPKWNFTLETQPLTDRKLIYFREVKQDFVDGVAGEPYVSRYAIGYEGKLPDGTTQEKVVFIDG